MRLTSSARSRRAAALAAALAVSLAACTPARPAYVPRDPALRAQPVYLYPADAGRPKAVVVFLGNDVGFWEPHQELALRLAGEGYAVAGLDVKRFIAPMPDATTARDSAYARAIVPLVARMRHELGGDSVPLVIGGHSIGAEIAVWTAAHAPPPGLVGVLALSPGSRGHLRVTFSDLANSGEPKGPDSFAVAETVGSLPPAIRVAVVRGASDKYRYADSAIVASGGERTRRFVVPFASHSLKRLTLAGPVVSDAMAFLLGRQAP